MTAARLPRSARSHAARESTSDDFKHGQPSRPDSPPEGPPSRTALAASSTALTQLIVLPSPILAGWLVQRFGSGAAFLLAAGFMMSGAAVLLPVRLYRGADRLPA